MRGGLPPEADARGPQGDQKQIAPGDLQAQSNWRPGERLD